MITIIYTTYDDKDAKAFAATLRTKTNQVYIRNGAFWYGEIEQCSVVYVSDKFSAIKDAYTAAGVDVKTYGVAINPVATDDDIKPAVRRGRPARVTEE